MFFLRFVDSIKVQKIFRSMRKNLKSCWEMELKARRFHKVRFCGNGSDKNLTADHDLRMENSRKTIKSNKKILSCCNGQYSWQCHGMPCMILFASMWWRNARLHQIPAVLGTAMFLPSTRLMTILSGHWGGGSIDNGLLMEKASSRRNSWISLMWLDYDGQYMNAGPLFWACLLIMLMIRLMLVNSSVLNIS